MKKRSKRDGYVDEAYAFVPVRPRRGPDVEAEAFAEEFVAQATSGEDVGERARDEFTIEELGGPFLEIDPEADATWFATS